MVRTDRNRAGRMARSGRHGPGRKGRGRNQRGAARRAGRAARQADVATGGGAERTCVAPQCAPGVGSERSGADASWRGRDRVQGSAAAGSRAARCERGRHVAGVARSMRAGSRPRGDAVAKASRCEQPSALAASPRAESGQGQRGRRAGLRCAPWRRGPLARACCARATTRGTHAAGSGSAHGREGWAGCSHGGGRAGEGARAGPAC